MWFTIYLLVATTLRSTWSGYISHVAEVGATRGALRAGRARSTVSSVGRRVGSPTLCGRLAEFELLEGWLGRATAGGLRVLLIEGSAGVGKTHLVEVALRTAADDDLTVLVGRGDELDQARPLGPLIGALLTTGEAGARGMRDDLARRLHDAGAMSSDRP